MNSNIVRAWKDEFYRQSLSDEERAQLPENPVGELDLTDAELESVFAAGQGDRPVSIGYEHCNSFYCPTNNHAYACMHHFTFDPDDCHNSRNFNACHHFTNYRQDCYYDKKEH